MEPPTIHHIENDQESFRIAHDGVRVISVTRAAGKTSSCHFLLETDTWEEAIELLELDQIEVPDDVYVPPAEPQQEE